MKRYQDDVHAFHKVMDQPIGIFDHAGRVLRDKLITEETQETIDAIGNRDMIETIDGLCDCLYVSVGAAVAFGFSLGEYLPDLSEPDNKSEPRFLSSSDSSIALLRGAHKLVTVSLVVDDLPTIIPALVGYVATLFVVANPFNIPLRPFWEEVHRSNLAKAGGPVREDGKRLKPPGWTPPDLKNVYTELYGRAAA